MYAPNTRKNSAKKFPSSFVGVALIIIFGAVYVLTQGYFTSPVEEYSTDDTSTVVGEVLVPEGVLFEQGAESGRKVIIFRMVQPDGGGILARYTSYGDGGGRVVTVYAVNGYQVKSGSGSLSADDFEQIEKAFASVQFKSVEKRNSNTAWFEVMALQDGKILANVGCNFDANPLWHIPPTEGDNTCQQGIINFINNLSAAHQVYKPVTDPKAAAAKIEQMNPSDRQSFDKVDLNKLSEDFLQGTNY